MAPDGWITTDISWRCPNYLDVTKPWPAPPGSVSHVYADNVIEHLPLAGARLFLKNAREALQQGGVIRIVTPDVHALAKVFLDGAPETKRLVLKRSSAAGLVAEHDVDILRVAFSEHGHHLGYLWDPTVAEAELRRAGFGAITFPGVSESSDPVLRGLESRTDEASRFTQLVVEARKD